ncbi:hypothetical protein D3C72_1442910 [compost metagenome]
MPASAQSRRCTSCSFDISSEKTNTGFCASTATLRQKFKASEVLPMAGRAARISKSLAWKPESMWSRS